MNDSAKARILIVEDEPSIAQSLEFVLQSEGFATHWETQGGRALDYLQRELPQGAVALAIMDVGLPDMTGFDVCKQLRKFSELPVMFLTARGDELDRVVGLEIGADDYVVKPFSPREVAARVKAILKRVQPLQTAATDAKLAVTYSREFLVEDTNKTIYYRNQLLSLTRFEYVLLQKLIAAPGQVFSREQLLETLGIASDANYDRSIDGHIKTLRAKLRAIAPDAEPIKTQRGFGYAYQPE